MRWRELKRVFGRLGRETVRVEAKLANNGMWLSIGRSLLNVTEILPKSSEGRGLDFQRISETCSPPKRTRKPEVSEGSRRNHFTCPQPSEKYL